MSTEQKKLIPDDLVELKDIFAELGFKSEEHLRRHMAYKKIKKGVWKFAQGVIKVDPTFIENFKQG